MGGYRVFLTVFSVIFLLVPFLPVLGAEGEWEGKDRIPPCRLRFQTRPRGATVFCSSMPVGKRFLGRADRGLTEPLPQGRHRFVFAKPGYRLEKRIFDVKKDGRLYRVTLRRANKPRFLGDLTIEVKSISGDRWFRRADIEYEDESHRVERGWASPDGSFVVIAIGKDRVKVRSLADGGVHWFLLEED